MTLSEYRESRGLSLEQCALELGLAPSTKGHLSRLENGLLPWPMKLALEIEVWSGGVVRARDILGPANAELLRRAIERQSAPAMRSPT